MFSMSLSVGSGRAAGREGGRETCHPGKNHLTHGRVFKKAAQKLLLLWAFGAETSTASFKKVFCFFFSKKKPSLFSSAAMPATARRSGQEPPV
jgi:hypothetical protein